MSFAFEKHGYRLDDFPSCPDCSAPLVEVEQERACLYEWLVEQCDGQVIVDLVPLPAPIPPTEWASVGIILSSGFMVPVDKAYVEYDLTKPVGVNEWLVGYTVTDVMWVYGGSAEKNDGMFLIEVTKEGSAFGPITLTCNLDILIYLLMDTLLRRVEP